MMNATHTFEANEMTPEEISNKAFDAANLATQKYLQEPHDWYPCGFAWVRIRPARGKFVSYLKENGLGSHDPFDGGFVIHNPSRVRTQSMNAALIGAQAFAEVLRTNSINAFAESRVD
jgi:hypothetical protein